MALNLEALGRIVDVLDRGWRGTREEKEKRGQVENRIDAMNPRDKLRVAMDGERVVEFDYTRRDGVTRHYVAHPYSRRGDTLYATESRHGHSQIHGFKLRRLDDVEVRTGEVFSPVWPTEPESV